MNDFNKVIERIKDILSKELGESRVRDKDVARALGLSPAYFAVLKKRKSLPLQQITEFCAKHRISINWMLFDQMPESVLEETERYATIRYFKSVHASAGGGAFNEDENPETLLLDAKLVEALGGRTAIKRIDAIKTTGDSMEPTIPDGSILFVDRTPQSPQDGAVYVLRIDENVFVKRIRLLEDVWEIASDNPLYPSVRQLPSDVEIVGKVLGTYRAEREYGKMPSDFDPVAQQDRASDS